MTSFIWYHLLLPSPECSCILRMYQSTYGLHLADKANCLIQDCKSWWVWKVETCATMAILWPVFVFSQYHTVLFWYQSSCMLFYCTSMASTERCHGQNDGANSMSNYWNYWNHQVVKIFLRKLVIHAKNKQFCGDWNIHFNYHNTRCLMFTLFNFSLLASKFLKLTITSRPIIIIPLMVCFVLLKPIKCLPMLHWLWQSDIGIVCWVNRSCCVIILGQPWTLHNHIAQICLKCQLSMV